MGFFSELLAVALPVVGAVVGGPAGAALGGTVSGLLGLQEETQLMVGGTGVRAITLPEAKAAQAAGVLGAVSPSVTGRFRKQTIVQTIDPATGKVISQKVTQGGVAVFAADAAAAKRFFRQIRKLDAKLPRKTQKVSSQKMLTDRLVNNALERAGDKDCPPKCP